MNRDSLQSLFKRYSYKIFITLFSASILLLFSACENDQGDFGLAIQPIGDKLLLDSFDSTTVAGHTLVIDSVRSDETSYAILGTYFDPIFGKTRAHFTTQFSLSVFPKDLGKLATADSAILFLRVSDFYGYADQAQTILVKELVNDIYADSVYYSNFRIQDMIPGINAGSGILLPTDTIVKIKLDQAVAQKLVSDSLAMTNPNEFKKYFKGLYLNTVDVASRGALVYFDLLSTDTKLRVYYSNQLTDSLSYDFIVYSTTARINMYEHDYSWADPQYRIRSFGTSGQDSVMYVQGIGGVESRISLPHHTAWTTTLPAAINKAELILPMELDDPSLIYFSPPKKLLLYTKSEEGTYEVINDQLFGESYFGGNYDIEKFQYKFNITQVYKDFVYGRSDELLLYVLPDRYPSNAARVALTTGMNSKKITLRVYYTRL